jgi:large subunit ribosomal protein L2
MGKRLKQQRQGKASPAFMRPARTAKADIRYRSKPVETKAVGEVIEFIDDPGHSAPVMLVKYEDGTENMLIAPEGIKIGDKIQEGKHVDITLGSIATLGNIPEGMPIYNIEVTPGDGGKMVRAAGSYATVRAHIGQKVNILLPSNQSVDLDNDCRAEIGAIAGGGIYAQPLMKAGKSFYMYHAMNRRWPGNRGVKSNPVDHPFGGKQHHKGASSMISRHAPPGAKVGHIAARRVGRKKRG